MKSNSQTTQIILSALFFIASFLGLVFFYTVIKSHEEVTAQKLTEWRTEAARRDEIKSLDSSMKKIEKEKAMLETHFAESANPVPFLDTLERLAESVGAENSVSSVDVAKDGKSLVVGMSASGSFSAFYKFLTLLENSAYDMEFLSIDMQKDGAASSEGGEWSAIIRIKLLTFIQ